MGKYKTLILAGFGAMGQGFCILGSRLLTGFEDIIILDIRNKDTSIIPGAVFLKGDVQDLNFLTNVLEGIKRDFVFVNLCSCTDNYRIRIIVSQYGGAYIDTACSMMFQKAEYRYSRLMPYTFQATENEKPHLLCCGINPGMVEIIARKMILDYFPGGKQFDIFLFEYDEFQTNLPGEEIGVSWSPETLIDEIMLSPTFRILQGQEVECENAPSDEVKSHMNGHWLDSRLVGHEELWNFGLIPGVKVENAFYSYAFRSEIMEVLAGEVDEAKRQLVIPGQEITIKGVDTVAVEVVERSSGISHTLVWATDHLICQERWGINAVQFQVSSSLLVFLELLLQINEWDKGKLLCASTLPIEKFGWRYIDDLMIQYGVEWESGETLDCHLERGKLA